MPAELDVLVSSVTSLLQSGTEVDAARVKRSVDTESLQIALRVLPSQVRELLELGSEVEDAFDGRVSVTRVIEALRQLERALRADTTES